MNTDEAPDQQADPADLTLLRNVRDLWEIVDPMPPELTTAIEFALELADADSEILRAATHQELAAARGDEQARLITFDGAGVTVMVHVGLNDDNTARLDGWVTPAASHRIELRMRERPLETTADDRGRFAFDGVPLGMVQLVVHADRRITTPVFVL